MMSNGNLTRRSILASSFMLAPRTARATVTADQFRKSLTGPICSVPTVYDSNFAIDYSSIRSIVDCGIKAGCRVFSLTAGNNQYDRLTYDEIKQLTIALVKAVAGRGMVIAATGQWWTGQAVDYARFADANGADAIQIFLPAYGDENSLFDHFRQIAKATRKALVLHGQVPLPLLKRLMDIETIVGYKEEYPAIYSVEVFSLYGKRLNIFAGGQKSHYLMYQPLGMTAYYSTFSTFAPSIPKQFWSACQTGDTAAAVRVVNQYDVPFFSKFSHAYWRATMEHFGTAKRFLRPPDVSLTSMQVAELNGFYRRLGLS